MASQVLSGGNTQTFTYTNNTGQNVRIVINFCSIQTSVNYGTMSWAGVNLSLPFNSSCSFGRNLAYSYTSTGHGNNMYFPTTTGGAIPTELMIANGQSFAINANTGGNIYAYNIVVIPENG